MKYMGSKRVMLQNGLGKLLSRELEGASRFVDLFCGSAAVACHVARKKRVTVLAYDMQSYSAVLANAVLTRTHALNASAEWDAWHTRARRHLREAIPEVSSDSRAAVLRARQWCSSQSDLPITRAYGGHYFSPVQSVWIDALRFSLPSSPSVRASALAALIRAASKCVAAPGHTAQPFQPTKSGLQFIASAWRQDVVSRTRECFQSVAGEFALKIGRADVGDANHVARYLDERDVAFVDPPYSGVQYSRFYHVLETIAEGSCGEVSGAGRYPTRDRRPRSRYSLTTQSLDALDELLTTISSRGATVVLTFPDHDCSNGLSADTIREVAREHFRVVASEVDSNFSTLGGKGGGGIGPANRRARKATEELILVLRPR